MHRMRVLYLERRGKVREEQMLIPTVRRSRRYADDGFSSHAAAKKAFLGRVLVAVILGGGIDG